MDRTPPGTYEAAAALHAAALELRRANCRFEVPSEAHTALQELADAQLQLLQALDGLGRWHQAARPGTEYEDERQSSEGVLEAAFELRTAVQQSSELYQSLLRAHHAGSQVRWCASDPD
jgi:predicted RNA-binding Zn ribbon-like protein